MRYMTVALTEISSEQYYAARSNDLIMVERPLGFITSTPNGRTLYLSVDGSFYSGQLAFTQTNDMFMQMKFNEVKNFVRAQFELAEAVTGA